MSTDTERRESGNRTKFTESFRELGLLVFIVLLGAAFQLGNRNFLSLENINDMLTNTAILAILAIGMTMVILTRGIDLSIGATIALSGMITALTVKAFPAIHPLLSILEGMVVGFAAGSLIGLLVARFDVLPIIATLGMMNILRGVTYLVSRGAWVSSYQMSDAFRGIATGKVLGLNNLISIAALVIAVAAYFLTQTRMGRRIYAIGSNPEAADVSGINRRFITWFVYAVMGVLSGLSGVLWVSKFASAQGDSATGYELNVIAAVVLGGVSISGGSGKMTGLLLGIVLLGILNNALPLIDVSPFWQQAIQGFVILAAILTNVSVKRSGLKQALRRRAI